MAFSSNIKDQILVDSAHHCCVCHKSTGTKVEVHHIIPRSEGGKDNYDNAIALCFDCHAAAGHFNDKHPKGLKFSRSELGNHRDRWFEIVRSNKIELTAATQVEIQEYEKYVDNPENFQMEKIIKNKYN